MLAAGISRVSILMVLLLGIALSTGKMLYSECQIQTTVERLPKPGTFRLCVSLISLQDLPDHSRRRSDKIKNGISIPLLNFECQLLILANLIQCFMVSLGSDPHGILFYLRYC